MGSGRSAGCAIGEGRTSPGRAIKPGIRADHVPGWLKPVPAPRTRHEVRDMSPSGSHRRDRLKHPLPSAKGVCRAECAGRGAPGMSRGLRAVGALHGSVCSVRGTPKVCHNMGLPWHSSNRCTRMQEMRPNHRRAAHQSKPAGRAHAPLCLTPINSEAPPHHPIGTATK